MVKLKEQFCFCEQTEQTAGSHLTHRDQMRCGHLWNSMSLCSTKSWLPPSTKRFCEQIIKKAFLKTNLLKKAFLMNWSWWLGSLKRRSLMHEVTLTPLFYFLILLVSIRYYETWKSAVGKVSHQPVSLDIIQYPIMGRCCGNCLGLINWLNICLLCVPLAFTEAPLVENEFFETLTKWLWIT